MRNAHIGMLTGLLLLAGCGGGEDRQTYTGADGSTATVTTDKAGDTTTITGSDGKGGTTTMAAGAGARWPEAAPAYAPAYPGGRVESSMAGVAEGKAGGMVTFTTSDAPQQVVDYYRDKAKAAGLTDVSSMDVNGAKIFSAGDKAGHALSVQAGPGEGGTSAAVTYGQR